MCMKRRYHLGHLLSNFAKLMLPFAKVDVHLSFQFGIIISGVRSQ